MGSRGAESNTNPNQFTIGRLMLISQVASIRKEADIKRAKLMRSGGQGGVSASPSKKCACCENFTLPISSIYEVCYVCGWIDDPRQNQNPDSHEGKNPLSLREAKEQYKI